MGRPLWALLSRELYGYLATPTGVLFLLVFPSLTAALTFYVGNFYTREIADLVPFFQFHPWVFSVLIPALGMRLWSEEFSSGTAELLLTLPISTGQAVLAKFLAAYIIVCLGLVLTLPMWVTVNILGSPDNGVILSAYISSGLMAGAFLSLTSLASAMTNNQIVAFVMAWVLCSLLLVISLTPLLSVLSSWLPQWATGWLVQAGFLSHFQGMVRGVVSLGSVVYFVGFMAIGLIGSSVAVELRRKG